MEAAGETCVLEARVTFRSDPLSRNKRKDTRRRRWVEPARAADVSSRELVTCARKVYCVREAMQVNPRGELKSSIENFDLGDLILRVAKIVGGRLSFANARLHQDRHEELYVLSSVDARAFWCRVAELVGFF